MALQTLEKPSDIFRRGSKTYYNSTKFFPANVRSDITTLYAFVRAADDFVDTIPQNAEGFMLFRSQYELALSSGNPSHNPYIDEFIKLHHRFSFNEEWTQAFLDAMQADLTKKTYRTIDELEIYMYGSANVIGLYLCKIMGVPQEAYPYAELCGKSMQYINFIRDINEDLSLGRIYIPQDVIHQAGINHFTVSSLTGPEKNAFNTLIKAEINRYRAWAHEAAKGFPLIPRRYRVPIKTASDMYEWTARTIQSDPQLIFKHKIKPSRRLIFFTGMKNWLLER